MSQIERAVKEFLERLGRNEVEFKDISEEDKESLEELVSKHRIGVQKFGANSKVARLNEKKLFDAINSLRIDGHMRYKI